MPTVSWRYLKDRPMTGSRSIKRQFGRGWQQSLLLQIVEAHMKKENPKNVGHGLYVRTDHGYQWDPKIRVYISGPITGTKDYAMRFAEAEAKLEKMGFSVFNPARVNAELPESLGHEEYMEISMAMLGMCDGIYMLNGWRDSRGACREYGYAIGKGLRIWH